MNDITTPQDPRWIDAVLAFWFDELKPADWFGGGDAVDARVRERFSALHASLSHDVPREPLATPRGTLAAIIVLDQFSRNLHRNDARAFANDPRALAIARDAVARGLDDQLPRPQRMFLYMPYMHAEDITAQRQSLQLFADAGLDEQRVYAQAHHDVIARFGRFPHRNRALGRVSTKDELAWLEQPDPRAGAAPG